MIISKLRNNGSPYRNLDTIALFLLLAMANVETTFRYALLVYFVFRFFTPTRQKFFVPTVIFVLTFIVTSLIPISIGIARNAPSEAIYGAIRIFVVAPIVFLLFCSFNPNQEFYQRFFYASFGYLIYFSAGIMLGVANQSGLSHWFIITNFFPDLISGRNDAGEFGISFTGINSILVAFPYFIGYGLTKSSRLTTPTFYTMVFLIFAMIIISGRRGFLVSSALCLGILFLYQIYAQRHNRRKSISTMKIRLLLTLPLVSGVIIFNVYGISFEGFITRLLIEISPNSERSLQAYALLNTFSQYPFFGSGYGTSADHIRNEGSPWQYELTYLNILATSGILGFAMFSCAFTWLLTKLIRIIRLQSFRSGSGELALLLMCISIHSAITFNPYIASWEWVWFLLLPVKGTSYRHGWEHA